MYISSVTFMMNILPAQHACSMVPIQVFDSTSEQEVNSLNNIPGVIANNFGRVGPCQLTESIDQSTAYRTTAATHLGFL